MRIETLTRRDLRHTAATAQFSRIRRIELMPELPIYRRMRIEALTRRCAIMQPQHNTISKDNARYEATIYLPRVSGRLIHEMQADLAHEMRCNIIVAKLGGRTWTSNISPIRFCSDDTVEKI